MNISVTSVAAMNRSRLKLCVRYKPIYIAKKTIREKMTLRLKAFDSPNGIITGDPI
ncbi:hypothetical protein [Porphyromonas cangingivalis]|uniref:hypothetical protein n=1 Tax=Porphyromonas cangingivalis TaxID=36874 RepID=UPI00131EF38C|nr:hypothetical protein [Porphyromonas cangingivalis]